MAVVQISRIQVRRGKGTNGIPQLAGGEFGWAVDNRALYIGNGSVAEGSPAVGNTKIITEHDDLFTLANTYTYLNGVTVQTGPSSTSPVKRTLQSRLDEIVNIKSFGATGDGATDETVAIQRAIDQLYINSSTKGTEQSRVRLYIPAGLYKVSATIYLPPYTTIYGDGMDKTKFNMTGNAPVFQTVNSSSTPGNYADDSTSTTLNQATNIHLEGFTITTVATAQPAVKLQSCKNSHFKEIKITGPWTTGTAITTDNAGIELESLSALVGTQKNKFDHIMFSGLSVGIASDDDIYNNHWHCSYFMNLGYGALFGEGTALGAQGQSTAPCKNKISQSSFTDIDKEAIVITQGINNISSHNNFENVGNMGGNEGNAQFSVIDYNKAGNSSVEDYFARTADLGYNQTYISTYKYVSEIKGKVNATLGGLNNLEVQEATSSTYFFRLPGDYSRTYNIEYNYSSSIANAQRSGTMTIMLDVSTNTLLFEDEYNYQGDSNYENALTFTAATVNTDGNLGVDTIIVSMLNSITNDQGEFNYKIKVRS
jgi:hypothetical protein|tara:strand:+ start:3037 stop:4653 length:1617 start_codon:yes stop_codon:yes gene_type:complete